MPTIAMVDGVAIRFYPDEHPPPHFHAIFAEFVAVIRIEPTGRLQGNLPPQKLRSVLSWTAKHRDDLMSAWLALEAGMKPKKIDD